MVVCELTDIGDRIFLRGGRPTRHVATYTWHKSRKILEFSGVEVDLMDFVIELHRLANRYKDSYDSIVIRVI